MIVSSTTDFREAARRKLPRFLFDYIDGGAYAERTLGRNVSDLADIALGCALGYLDFRFADLGWRPQYPNLVRHADKLFKRPPFQATAPYDVQTA